MSVDRSTLRPVVLRDMLTKSEAKYRIRNNSIRKRKYMYTIIKKQDGVVGGGWAQRALMCLLRTL